MRKLLIIIFSLIAAGVTVQAVALNNPFDSAPKKTNSVTQQKNDKILLYAEANTKRLIAKLEPNAALIPIIDKGAWTKVGNPRNGQVGWIQRQQVRRAREAFYRPDVQTVYVSRETNKSGKPSLSIVAYKNGKKVSPAEAKRMYRLIRMQEVWENNRMRRIARRMNRMMERDRIIFSEPWYQPEIIFPDDQGDQSASVSYADPDDLMS